MNLLRENVLKIAAVTSGVIVLYEISTQLLIYKYFRFDYYITIAVIIAFAIGAMLFRKRALPVPADPVPADLLTTKELQVLEMIAEGKSNKEIAHANFVELSTVKTHINKIFAKLEVKNRREAVSVFRKNSNTEQCNPSPSPSV